jgi:sugar phosphate permease
MTSFTLKLPFNIHYSWVIVFALSVVQIFGTSISFSAGIMVAPLTNSFGGFGWNVALVGAGIGTYYLTGACMAPITGYLGDRYGARKMLLLSAVMYFISMNLLGLITSVWQFFIVFGVMLATTQSLAMVPLMATVSGWFKKRLGLGIGVLYGAGGIGAATFAPVVGTLIESIGWTSTFMSLGFLGGGMLLTMLIIVRNKPSDIGLLPYGSDIDEAVITTTAVTKQADQTRAKYFNRAARTTKPFWYLPMIHGFGCAGHGVILIYILPYAMYQGAFSSLGAAGTILTVLSLVSIVSRLTAPILAEKFGTRKMMFISLLIQGITVLGLMFAVEPWAFYLFSAVFGLGFGAEWTAYIVINKQYYGEGPMGHVYGVEQSGALLGHAVATILCGGLLGLFNIYFDAGVSFMMIFIVSILFNVAGLIFILLLQDTSKIIIPDWEKHIPQSAPESITGMTD